jgi:mannosylglucosylglycerate synthase
MKISIIHYAAPPVVGGVETVLARQAQQFERAGHQVRILAGRGETWNVRIPVEIIPIIDSRNPHILKAKARLDAGVVPADFNALVEQIGMELGQALQGAELVIAHNVASLHKNLALTAALYNLSQTAGGPRWILWHHDLAWTADRYRKELHAGWPWDLLRTAWPGVRQVTVSEARRIELAGLMGIGPEQITVIPAGLDLPDFLNLQTRTMKIVQTFGLLRAAPLLLTPVRITRRKNLELSLKILAELQEDFPAAMLVVTGPPGAHNPSNQRYLDKLIRLRGELGLEESAILLAESVPDGLPDACVADLYRLADALLLPSHEEGFGIPILEAGLARLPIFCSRLSPLQDLAGNWAEYFSPTGRPKQIAHLISRRLRKDPVFNMQLRVRSQFTWDAIYERQIASLIEGR